MPHVSCRWVVETGEGSRGDIALVTKVLVNQRVQESEFGADVQHDIFTSQQVLQGSQRRNVDPDKAGLAKTRLRGIPEPGSQRNQRLYNDNR